jgi:hypothetical protein
VIVSNKPTASSQLSFPALGIAAGGSLQTWSLTDLNRQFGDYLNLHAGWVRHDFDWSVIEPQQSTYNWAGYDQLVRAARSHGVNLIATIDYTPAWANGGHSDHRYQPSTADQFGSFAGQVAARYAPQGVHAYEIWNEPNIQYWQPVPSPSYYTQVLCSAYRYIHAADPQAIVITGGTSPAADSPSTYSPQTWLSDVYADGGKPCFDAVGHHPYIDSSTTPSDLGNAWYLMYDAYPPSNLRGIMSANGDANKRIWATEVGCNRATIGDQECANRIQQAFQLWRNYSWAGALGFFIYWDPNVYGLIDGNFVPRPEFYAYQTAATAHP